MQLTIEIKSVYGVQRIYAVCNNAKLITKLKNSKTLSKEDISILRELGYTIETKQPTIQKGIIMKDTVDIYSFRNAMKDYFSYDAIKALWEYFENYENDTGTELELDPIAFSCDFNEYSSLEEFHKEYDKEEYPTVEKLQDHTTVIPFEDNEGFLIQAF